LRFFGGVNCGEAGESGQPGYSPVAVHGRSATVNCQPPLPAFCRTIPTAGLSAGSISRKLSSHGPRKPRWARQPTLGRPRGCWAENPDRNWPTRPYCRIGAFSVVYGWSYRKQKFVSGLPVFWAGIVEGTMEIKNTECQVTRRPSIAYSPRRVPWSYHN